MERRLSQEKLAADASLDRAYLGGIERKQENPTLDVLQRLAECLGVMLADLFREPIEGETFVLALKPGRPKGTKRSQS